MEKKFMDFHKSPKMRFIRFLQSLLDNRAQWNAINKDGASELFMDQKENSKKVLKS